MLDVEVGLLGFDLPEFWSGLPCTAKTISFLSTFPIMSSIWKKKPSRFSFPRMKEMLDRILTSSIIFWMKFEVFLLGRSILCFIIWALDIFGIQIRMLFNSNV